MKEEYQKLTPPEHVLLRPTIYAGSTITYEADSYLWNGTELVLKTVPKNDALEKILGEVLDNIVDNQSRGVGGTVMKVKMTANTFSASNDGQHISISKHSNGELIPTMLFSSLNCGSNFNDDTEQGRTSIGANGVGVVLTNILSTHFNITILDPDQDLCLKQSWSHNMSQKTEPKITKKKCSSKKESIVTTVECVPDLKRFGIESLEPLLSSIHTRLIQLAAITTLKISFNGVLIKNNTFKKYIHSFQCIDKFVFAELTPTFSYGLAISGGEYHQQSFVNAQPTTSGGTHVNVVTSQIIDTLLEYFKKKFKGTKLSRHQIKQRLFVFVNVTTLRNPSFRSQQKIFLTNPFSKTAFRINPKLILKNCTKIGLLDQLEELLLSKEDKKMEDVMTGSKKKSISVDKLIDASWAGTAKSAQCSLYLTEGDSARTFVVSGMAQIGAKQNGVFPLRGKLLNCYSASNAQIIANKEIQNIVKILGLSKKKSTLRYGKVVILTDSDVDGFHIMGLILAYFQKFFPELLRNGFFQRMITPVIVATKRQEKHEFFAVPDFTRWYEGKNGYNIRYLKGLGSSTRQEAVSYFSNISKYLKHITMDEFGGQKMDLFFNKDRSSDRKEWLKDTNNMDLDYESKEQAVEAFVDTELKQFSLETLTRAIPSLVDGLKESQRKIMFACFRKFDSTNKPFKIAQLASYTAEKTAYLHGETSLGGAITKMTQAFPGSNNLPLLVPEGQTGSRLQNGADAASTRYTFTKLQDYTRLLFRPEDDAILTYREEEGQSIEPSYFVPIIPMILVNGASGISVGYRCEIPQHDPVDIIKSILNKLDNGDFLPINPCYNGFLGTITEDNQNWYTHGVFERVGNKVTITEIPIGVSTDKYTEYLKKLSESGQIVRFTSAAPDENSVNFSLQVTPTFNPSCLKLTGAITKRCLNLLVDNTVWTFASAETIINKFHILRLEAYTERRTHVIKQLKEDVFYIGQKKLFVELVIQNKLDIRNTRPFIIEQAKHFKIGRKHTEEFLTMSISALSKERVAKLGRELSTRTQELQEAEHSTVNGIYRKELNELKRALTSKKRKRE